MTTKTQQAESAKGAHPDKVDRLHEQLRPANGKERTAEAEAAESRHVLHQVLDERHVDEAKPTSSTTTDQPREPWAEASKPVSDALVTRMLERFLLTVLIS